MNMEPIAKLTIDDVIDFHLKHRLDLDKIGIINLDYENDMLIVEVNSKAYNEAEVVTFMDKHFPAFRRKIRKITFLGYDSPCGILLSTSDSKAEMGTGTFVEYNDMNGFVTAAHVLQTEANYA